MACMNLAPNARNGIGNEQTETEKPSEGLEEILTLVNLDFIRRISCMELERRNI